MGAKQIYITLIDSTQLLRDSNHKGQCVVTTSNVAANYEVCVFNVCVFVFACVGARGLVHQKFKMFEGELK